MNKYSLSVLLVCCAAVIWASGVIPAIIPAAVPTAYKVGNSSKFQLGTTTGAVAGNCAVYDADLNMSGQSCTAGPAGPTGVAGMLTNTVTLTAADIEALNTTPFVLVPAQGSGTVIWPISAYSDYKYGTTAYTNAAGVAVLGAAYAGDTDTFSSYTIHPQFYLDAVSNNLLDATASVVMTAGPVTNGGQTGWGGNGILPLRSFADNQALVLSPMDNQGGIRTAAIRTAGTGYAVDDVSNVTGCAGSGGQVKITAAMGGVPTSISVQGIGTSYTAWSGPCATTASVGSGMGLTVDLTTKAWYGGDGTLTVTTAYRAVTLH